MTLTARWGLLLVCMGLLHGTAAAEFRFRPIATQFIAALGDPSATSGTGAETWGLWAKDPGPRGVRLSNYEALKITGVAPAEWNFDGSNWWLEEHGLIMEQPVFPIPPGQYVVTGDRDKMALLTVHEKDANGKQRWEIDAGATLYDVTHLGCRAARYTPASGANSCTPAQAQQSEFPVAPGGPMPPVPGCNRQDFQVLIVVGVADES
jgi:hypothetical protein